MCRSPLLEKEEEEKEHKEMKKDNLWEKNLFALLYWFKKYLPYFSTKVRHILDPVSQNQANNTGEKNGYIFH